MSQKYRSVSERIRSQLLTTLEPGQALDSERRLAETFGVSRVTIRQALGRLETDGLITRVHGSGTYRTDLPLIGKTVRLTSFSVDMHERGLTPSSRVLGSSLATADKQTADSLGIEEGDAVLSLRRLRLADSRPMALEQVFLPVSRFPDIHEEDFGGSLYELLERRYGTQIEAARQRIRARKLAANEAQLLDVGDGAPALVVERISRDRYGVPVEYATTTYRADRYEFDMMIRANSD